VYGVRRSADPGRTAAVELRSLVGERVPLVVAKALTFTAQRAQAEIQSLMPKVFDGGATQSPFNSTRVESASVANLVARVAVKDLSSNHGTLPEDYLLPQVQGGCRRSCFGAGCEVETAQAQPHRVNWARPLKRVLCIDMLHCPNCGGSELKIIAAILERPVIEKILTHLGLDPQLPPRGRARET
jgi:hypothetical protein